ncbi:CidA/LrgA family protein [Microbulbifer halophilus]|uniref:CidA/LrgA family protein n=1 Tax=Microbulbifer halophilus TaxID=453963 RepID=A0ABW5E852_9GAMM|nr:CidA/LrgA family protein [Microbulbifer halophilus]MCW8125503.1 CidA/LrgA family protein [Microbulbifer halophilus]
MEAFRPIAHWLGGAAILLGCSLLGDLLSDRLSLPVPGPVVGMLLLLAGLMIYGSVPRGLALVSSQLLRLLALLFLPAATGVFFLRHLDATDWLAILAATTVGTLLSFTLCALLLKKLLRDGGGERGDG